MKVLHYVDDNVLSWAQPYIQLLEALRKLGCENVITCRPGGTLSGLLQSSGFEVHTYSPLISSLPVFARGFLKTALRVKPDIIHTRLSSAANIAGAYAKSLNVPVLATIDKFPKAKYYKNVNHIIPCSRSVAEYMLTQGFSRENMTVIHNAVDVKSYARNEAVRKAVRQSEGLSDEDICFLGAGRFVDWKGFDDLLTAFAKFINASGEPEKFSLWLAGDGPERGRLHMLAHTLGISERVKFWGFAGDIRPLLWGADVYVHPSWGDEAFGLSLLEAMSAGLPAIASRSGGMTEILESHGLLFPKRNIDALADCMNEASHNTQALGRSCLKRARDFDTAETARHTFSLYTRVLKDG